MSVEKHAAPPYQKPLNFSFLKLYQEHLPHVRFDIIATRNFPSLLYILGQQQTMQAQHSSKQLLSNQFTRLQLNS